MATGAGETTEIAPRRGRLAAVAGALAASWVLVLYLLLHLLPHLEYALHLPGWVIGALIIITFSAAHVVVWPWYRRTYRRLGVDQARVRAFEHQQATWFRLLHFSFKYLPIVAVFAAAVALRFAHVALAELWVVLAVVFGVSWRWYSGRLWWRFVAPHLVSVTPAQPT
ncbi:MAG TPA: hypothetical protein VJQ08_00735 [Candidatus Dormibacteraeota bacterium]|nr:hypothetical protein [Candidatus Dormibacteraeota bacterium]